MKKFILLAIVALLTLSVIKAQTVPSNVTNYTYCEIIGVSISFTTKIKINIDYGQPVDLMKGVQPLKDSKGNIIKFNSMVDAINYMNALGWEFFQVYFADCSHYLFRKPITKEEASKILSAKEMAVD